MPATVHVSRSKRGAYRSIGAALEGARNRPLSVLIETGTYQEALTVAGDVEFEAVGGPVSIVAAEGTTATCSGTVVFRGLSLTNYAGTVLHCHGGSLTVENCELRGLGKTGASLRAEHGTGVTMRASTARSGPVYLTGVSGVLKDCELLASRTNGVWVKEGGSLRISGGAITDPSGHGVRADSATVRISGCTLTGTGSAAVAVSDDSRLTMTDTVVRDAHKSGVDVMQQSRAEIGGCTIERCERGVWATDGSTVELSRVTVADARVSALTVNTRSRVEATDCESRGAVRYGLYLGGGGVLTARHLLIQGGEIGLWLEEGRGEVTGLRLSGADVGVRVGQAMSARITDGLLTGCGQGVDAPKGRALLELTGTTVEGPRREGVALAGDARLTARNCEVTGAGGTGVLLSGSARLDAAELTVRDGAAAGVRGTGTARLTLRDSVLTGNAGGDLAVEDDCVQEVIGSTAGGRPLLPGAAGAVGAAGRPAAAAGSGDTGEPGGPARTAGPGDPGDPMAELAELIGLAPVKRQVRTQVNIIRLAERRRAVGLPTPPLSRHLVFSGPPGTGKTTVARLYGRVLASLGVLADGAVHEVVRSDLVGKYLGHTGPKTREAFLAARGRVLFIDEAYALARTFGANSDFGQEAIDELVKLMEDHRDDVVVIVAGYTAEMGQFLAANPGLSSRFSRTIEFPPYSPAELLRIVELTASRARYVLDDAVRRHLLAYFERQAGGDAPGNARDARNLFESMMENQAERLSAVGAPTLDELTHLDPADLPWPPPSRQQEQEEQRESEPG
ncbi:right-handed parallel beta-helix repeat-containing protein [Streptomyces sp. NBC_00448]|uniref:right-handed parallel beta-helix repeat-containing protein n=1 Tax=Streptomyces sp. NBC_00448 TaxID=2903652 RepID=UPI002E1A9C46